MYISPNILWVKSVKSEDLPCEIRVAGCEASFNRVNPVKPFLFFLTGTPLLLQTPLLLNNGGSVPLTKRDDLRIRRANNNGW